MARVHEIFGQLECIAIANGFDGLWDWLRQFDATLPKIDELYFCSKCDVWLRDPERLETGEAVCSCGAPMSQSPF